MIDSLKKLLIRQGQVSITSRSKVRRRVSGADYAVANSPRSIKFGAIYTRRLKRKHRAYGDTFYIDEVFVKINGKQHYLWRAVDQDGDVVDYITPRA